MCTHIHKGTLECMVRAQTQKQHRAEYTPSYTTAYSTVAAGGNIKYEQERRQKRMLPQRPVCNPKVDITTKINPLLTPERREKEI